MDIQAIRDEARAASADAAAIDVRDGLAGLGELLSALPAGERVEGAHIAALVRLLAAAGSRAADRL